MTKTRINWMQSCWMLVYLANKDHTLQQPGYYFTLHNKTLYTESHTTTNPTFIVLAPCKTYKALYQAIYKFFQHEYTLSKIAYYVDCNLVTF